MVKATKLSFDIRLKEPMSVEEMNSIRGAAILKKETSRLVSFFVAPIVFFLLYVVLLAVSFDGIFGVSEVGAIDWIKFTSVAMLLFFSFLGFSLGFMAFFSQKINDSADDVLLELMYVEPNLSPDECIKWSHMVSEDSMVRAYQNKLVKFGRFPVMGEFKAAKKWLSTEKPRETKSAEAKEVMQKLGYTQES